MMIIIVIALATFTGCASGSSHLIGVWEHDWENSDLATTLEFRRGGAGAITLTRGDWIDGGDLSWEILNGQLLIEFPTESRPIGPSDFSISSDGSTLTIYDYVGLTAVFIRVSE